jgi:hypothetical protein
MRLKYIVAESGEKLREVLVTNRLWFNKKDLHGLPQSRSYATACLAN